MEPKKIGLLTAMLINISIMVGAGIFLNIRPLVAIAGSLGFLGYILSAAILFPFVYTLAKMARNNPVCGGIYVYSHKYIHPLVGFISGWCYFIGMTVSVAFLAYTFTSFIQSHVKFLQSIPAVGLTCITILSLAALNIAGARVGGKVQLLFISAKVFPIACIMIFGLLNLFSGPLMEAQSFFTLFSTIPLAIYALIGFEVSCTIAHLIDNPAKNVFRAIIGSFLIVAFLFSIFELIVILALGKSIVAESMTLAQVVGQLFTSAPLLGKIVTSLMYTSVIAGSFGILTSNCCNLFTLSKHGHFFGLKPLLIETKGGTPVASILIESLLACLILVISKNQIALQSMAVFGVVLAFLLSAIAAFKATRSFISLVGIASCGYILFLCFHKMQSAGVSIPYILFIVGGIVIAVVSRLTRNPLCSREE